MTNWLQACLGGTRQQEPQQPAKQEPPPIVATFPPEAISDFNVLHTTVSPHVLYKLHKYILVTQSKYFNELLINKPKLNELRLSTKENNYQHNAADTKLSFDLLYGRYNLIINQYIEQPSDRVKGIYGGVLSSVLSGNGSRATTPVSSKSMYDKPYSDTAMYTAAPSSAPSGSNAQHSVLSRYDALLQFPLKHVADDEHALITQHLESFNLATMLSIAQYFKCTTLIYKLEQLLNHIVVSVHNNVLYAVGLNVAQNSNLHHLHTICTQQLAKDHFSILNNIRQSELYRINELLTALDTHTLTQLIMCSNKLITLPDAEPLINSSRDTSKQLSALSVDTTHPTTPVSAPVTFPVESVESRTAPSALLLQQQGLKQEEILQQQQQREYMQQAERGQPCQSMPEQLRPVEPQEEQYRKQSEIERALQRPETVTYNRYETKRVPVTKKFSPRGTAAHEEEV